MSSGPVRWGFLGAGWIAARALAPAVHASGAAELVAAASRDADRAAALGPSVATHSSYQALLDDPQVEAVYVSLTNEVHARWSIAALAAGKHVLCEKPLGMSALEVDEMAAAARRHDRILVEASWYRWHPRVRAAQELVAGGAVGRVRHASVGFTFAGELDGNYRLDPSRGGGALYDVGCYAVSAALWAFGTTPLDVVARQQLGPTGVDLVTEAVLRFADGDAEVRAGIAEPPAQWLVVRGDGGEVELRDAPYTSWSEDATELLVSDGRSTRRRSFAPVDAYRLMVEAVSARIRGGGDWVLPLDESRATAAVLDACFTSARADGAPVDLGSDRWTSTS